VMRPRPVENYSANWRYSNVLRSMGTALRGRSGPPAITSMALIEALMLINIATLLLGGAFILKGGGWFN
jgi:hypothetical protein